MDVRAEEAITHEESEKLAEVSDALTEAWDMFYQTLLPKYMAMIESLIKTIKKVETNMTPRQKRKLIYGGDNGNNWRKLHGKPMMRWRWMNES